MAKKKVNQAFIKDQTKTQYEGFVQDFIDLKEATDELDLVNRIDEILDQVKAMRDQIEIPDIQENNQQAEVNGKDATQRKALEQLVAQLENIKQFATNMKEQGNKNTSLNSLINWSVSDPDSNPIFINEEEYQYSRSISSLKEILNESVALFCGGNQKGFPRNIKRNIDTYNLTDEYREFTTENSVMAKVDKILTDVSKLYTKTMKMSAKATRYKAEKELEKELDYDKKNLEEFGKVCYNLPNYSMKNVREEFVKAFTDNSDAQKAEKEAEKKYTEAKNELEELKIKHAEHIKRGPAEEEKKKAALAEFNRVSDIAEKIKSIKNTLENVTYKKEYPDLKMLDEAAKKKYSSYQELLEESKTNMAQLALAQSDVMSKVEKINSDINYAIKHSDDNRLRKFVEDEGTRYKFMEYPKIVREIRAKFASLPDFMRIDCDTYNLIQINKEIDVKIKEKKGDNVLWFAMRGMLEHARKLCPTKFVAYPLSERVLKECEANGKEYIEKLDNDELHKKIKEYNALKDKSYALEEEIRELNKHDKKDKDFWTKDNKTLLKNKNEELKKVKKDIETLKKDPIYVEGASSVDKMMKESVGYASTVYQYNVYQVDLYAGVIKNFKDGKEKHDQGTYMAQQAIYTKLLDIYESIPENAVRVTGKPETTKKDTELKVYLDKMKNARNKEVFIEGYKQFTAFINAMKELYSEEKMKMVNDKVKEVEEVLKDTNYEARLEEYNNLLVIAEDKYSKAKADYEEKKAVSRDCKNRNNIALTNLKNNEKYYERKENAEKYDAANAYIKTDAYDIDKNGDRLFMMIRQPFNEYYARKDYAKKKRHGDSDQYTNMITRLTAVIELRDDASIDQYKQVIGELKTYAQTYVRVREGQFFISRSNPMRKYRLSFAKGLIDLCDDQLKNLDGTEKTVTLNPEVEKYLSRKEKVNVKNLSKKEKEDAIKAYNDSLDARKEEAIEAYKNSVEFKARYAYKESKLIKDISQLENNIDGVVKLKKSLSKIKDSEKMIQGAAIRIQEYETNRARLVKELHILQIKHKLENDKLSEPEKNALEETLRKYENDEFDVEGKNRKRKEPEKNRENIIIQEDEKNLEDVKEEPIKNSKKEILEEEERMKMVDRQLDKLNNSNKKDKRKKSIIEINNNNNIINNNINNNMNQDLNNSFDSIAAVERQIEEAMNPVYNDNPQKKLLDQ